MPSPKSSRKTKADFTPNIETFRLLFTNHPIPMWIYDLKTLAFLDVNDAATEKYGYTRDEFLALTIKDIHPVEDVARLVDNLEQERPPLQYSGEWRHSLKNGQIIDVEITTHVLDFEGQKAKLVMAQDITKRKLAEQVLLEKLKLQEQITKIAETAPGGLFSVQHHADGTVTMPYVSPIWEELWGLKQEEVRENSKPVFDLIHPDDIEHVLKISAESATDMCPLHDEFRILNPVKGEIWVESRSAPVRQPDGSILWHGVTTDINVRKQAENALKESEKRFATIFRANPAAIAMTRLDDGHLVDVNAAWQRITGYVHTEVVDHTAQELNLWVSLEQRERLVEMLGEQGKAHGEIQIRHKSGEIRDLLMSADLIELTGKRYMVTMAQDITESKQAEIQRQNFYDMLNASLNEIYIFDAQTLRFEFVSAGAISNLGYSLDELRHMTPLDLKPEFTPEAFAALIEPLHLGTVPVINFETIHRRADGSLYSVEVRLQIFSQYGHLVFLAVILDITWRKQAEEALAESEKKLRTLFETMSEGIVYENHDGKIISANPSAERLLGLSFDQMQDRTSVDSRWKAIHEDGSPFPGEAHSLNIAAKTGKPATGEVMGIYNPKSDDYVWLSVNSTPEFLPGEKKPFRAYAVFRDITERKQAEDMLQRNEEILRQFVEYSPAAIAMFDRNMKYIVASRRYLSDYGLGEQNLIGRSHYEIFPEISERWKEIHRRCLAGTIERCDEDPFPRADGQLDWVKWEVRPWYELTGEIGGIILFSEVITERKQAEQKLTQYSEHLEEMVQERTSELRETQEKLVRNEKLAVLGQLAGSVGHELRNPLAVINNALYYLKLIGADSSEKVKEYLGIIQTETRTAEKIITDLLDFARIKSVDLEPVSASKLVERVLGRYPAPKAVNVRLEVPENLSKLYVDPRQMEQVLGNLVINACQSMSAGGELTITAHQEQEMIAIAVKDTGVGIPPENMKKLFEPLFTTKAKGIGLGLAVSQKLAEANGGRIEVESEAGKGSTFKLVLPVHNNV